MMSLRELQENFQAYVLNQKEAIATPTIVPRDLGQRINIYRHGYVLRLLEVLEKDFPTFRKYIGEALFEKISRDYINSYPSDNFSICNFSRHYSTFLKQNNYDCHWSEIVIFEAALANVLDAPDGPYLTLADLGTITADDWPHIQFSFHPSAQFYKYHYNAPQIVYAIMLEQTPPEPSYSDLAIDWIVWRYNFNSYFETFNYHQWHIVNAICQQKTFVEICEVLCQFLPEDQVPQFAASSLGNWIEKNILSSYTLVTSQNYSSV